MAEKAPEQNVFDVVREAGETVVTDVPKLDIDSYIQNYSGRTRFTRLIFIGSHSTILAHEALKAAIAEAKLGRQWDRYNDAVKALSTIAPADPESVLDHAWAAALAKRNKHDTDQLEAQLKGYKNNLIKESTRMGNEDLGRHYQSIGELPKALEAFNRMRADASIQKHVVDVSKHTISVAIELCAWNSVLSSVSKIMAVPLPEVEEKAIQPFLKSAAGLAYLSGGKFYDSASAFILTDAGMGSTYNDLISPNDVAIYGGLCALASMGRDELQRKVLDNSTFRTYLELEPHIRKAIQLFVNGRYSACLAILEGYRNDYFLDIYLAAHIKDIYYLIRSKSIVQYFIPFSCVTLDSLNEAFMAPGESIVPELVEMIKRRSLVARIDTQNRLLTAVDSSPRATLQSETLASAKAYEREMRRRLQRMNIVGAGLELKPSKGSGNQQGRGGLPPGVDQPYNMRGWENRGPGLRPGHADSDSGYE